jgi:PIN domain nuclease of toxin-antitoxin system
MRLLLDAHTLIWAVDDPSRLSPAATTALQNPGNQLLLGAGILWEIAIKVGLKKLTLTQVYLDWMRKAIADLGLLLLPVSVEYADAQTNLPHHHGDPFDQLLVAQAIVEAIPVVSADVQLDGYGITRVW